MEGEDAPDTEESSAIPGQKQLAGNASEGNLDVEDDVVDERQRWTIETFEDRPVNGSAKNLKALRDLSSKILTVIGRIEKYIEMANDTARALEKAHPDDNLISMVQDGVFRAIEERNSLQIQIDVIDHIILKLRTDNVVENVQEMFQSLSETRLAEYMSLTKRAKFKTNQLYIEFRTGIWEIHHEDQPCPPMTEWLSKEADDESDDDEVEMGGTTQTYRCPLTMRVLVEACKSASCGHLYSHAAIMQHIIGLSSLRHGNGSVKCPVAGCNSTLTKETIIMAPEIQKRADEYERRQQLRDEEANESFVNIADD